MFLAPSQANQGGSCVFVEDSRQAINNMSVPSYVTVVPYSYTTRRDYWSYYGKLSEADLYNELYMRDLPEYAQGRPALDANERRVWTDQAEPAFEAGIGVQDCDQNAVGRSLH